MDLGNMLAHVTEYALRRFGDPGCLAPQGQAFLAGYADGGRDISDDTLRAARGLSFLRHLDICGRFADRAGTFPLILDFLHDRAGG